MRDGDGSGIVSVLEEWGAGSELHVVTWFDQSGQGNDVHMFASSETSLLQWQDGTWRVSGKTPAEIAARFDDTEVSFISP